MHLDWICLSHMKKILHKIPYYISKHYCFPRNFLEIMHWQWSHFLHLGVMKRPDKPVLLWHVCVNVQRLVGTHYPSLIELDIALLLIFSSKCFPISWIFVDQTHNIIQELKRLWTLKLLGFFLCFLVLHPTKKKKTLLPKNNIC